GTGKGSNLGAYSRLAEISGLHITASGGVSSLQEIKELRAMGLYAAILGKALYAGTLHLGEAIETAL
ncbi:MAG: HisA/HisF-related TIM barrel protein, partial [Oscillospiraceae bacterium]